MRKKLATDFDKLQVIWDKKLKDAGFDDIETRDDKLKFWSSQFSKRKAMAYWQSKASYYSMAESFLNEHKFSTNLERIIWEYHANAISLRDIADLLRKAKITDCRKDTIRLVVIKLQNIMKNKYKIGTHE